MQITRLCSILFAIMSVTQVSFASVDTLELKDGTVVTSTITGVDSAAFYFLDHSLISLKTVRSATTSNESIGTTLQSLYPDVRITQHESLFTISFDDVTIKPRLARSGDVFDRFSVLVNYLTDPAEDVEAQLICSLRSVSNFEEQVATSQLNLNSLFARPVGLEGTYHTLAQIVSLVAIASLRQEQTTLH